jgi:hypothetical protein
LMSTTMIATVLAAFCAIVLAQERDIEIVGWFPDRDNITTSHERIAEYMYGVNFSAFCQRHDIDERPIKLLIGRPEPDAANPRQDWYDELVRISVNDRSMPVSSRERARGSRLRRGNFRRHPRKGSVRTFSSSR